MIKYISIVWLVFRCFLVPKKENLTGFSTGLTGRSKNLDPTGNPTGQSTRPVSISEPGYMLYPDYVSSHKGGTFALVITLRVMTINFDFYVKKLLLYLYQRKFSFINHKFTYFVFRPVS